MRTSRRLVLVALTVTCLTTLATAGCGERRAAAGGGGLGAPVRAVAPKVRWSRLPPLHLAAFRKGGAYPRVAGVGLSAANRSLRRLVEEYEAQYRPGAKYSVRECVRLGLRKCRLQRGLGFFVFLNRPQRFGVLHLSGHAAILDAPQALSVLIPTIMAYPGGIAYEGWFSATVLLDSGRVIRLHDLIRGRRNRLRLARLAKSMMLHKHPWLKQYLTDPIDGRINVRGFIPRAGNYSHYVLLRKGLRIGFVGEQVGFQGRLWVTIPYDRTRGYLSPLGRRLVQAAMARTARA